MGRKPHYWKNKAKRVEGDLEVDVWYRSPLWEKGHLAGISRHHWGDGIAWCGRPLVAARDLEDDELGGLWYDNRTSSVSRCSECKAKHKEFVAGVKEVERGYKKEEA